MTLEEVEKKAEKTGGTQMYGIKVPLAVDDYVWVCYGSSFDLNPVLFKTKEQAMDAAQTWGPLAMVCKWEPSE